MKITTLPLERVIFKDLISVLIKISRHGFAVSTTVLSTLSQADEDTFLHIWKSRKGERKRKKREIKKEGKERTERRVIHHWKK